MNPNYTLIVQQLNALLKKVGPDPKQQSLHVDLLIMEKNIKELYSDFELMARQLRDVLGKRDQYNADAAYYRVIMRTVQSDPTLMSQWTDLLMTMKLTNPDIEKELRQAAETYLNLN